MGGGGVGMKTIINNKQMFYIQQFSRHRELMFDCQMVSEMMFMFEEEGTKLTFELWRLSALSTKMTVQRAAMLVHLGTALAGKQFCQS